MTRVVRIAPLNALHERPTEPFRMRINEEKHKLVHTMVGSKLFWEKYLFFMQFFRLLPKISPNLGNIFIPRPSYFKVLDPPLP
jgi:hypothetical protein